MLIVSSLTTLTPFKFLLSDFTSQALSRIPHGLVFPSHI